MEKTLTGPVTTAPLPLDQVPASEVRLLSVPMARAEGAAPRAARARARAERVLVRESMARRVRSRAREGCCERGEDERRMRRRPRGQALINRAKLRSPLISRPFSPRTYSMGLPSS